MPSQKRVSLPNVSVGSPELSMTLAPSRCSSRSGFPPKASGNDNPPSAGIFETGSKHHKERKMFDVFLGGLVTLWKEQDCPLSPQLFEHFPQAIPQRSRPFLPRLISVSRHKADGPIIDSSLQPHIEHADSQRILFVRLQERRRD